MTADTAAHSQRAPRVPYHGLTRAQVLQLLSVDDATVLANQISAMAQDSQNPVTCDLLKALWDGISIPDAEISSEIVSATRVRLALASTLHQCRSTGGDQTYSAYVRSVLESTADELDRSRAALALGIVGNDEDVPHLLSLAENHTSVTVGIGAVGGLSALGTSTARNALEQIASGETAMPEVKDTANRMLK